MKVILPTPFVGGTLAGSTVPETDAPAWSSSTTYAQGDKVIFSFAHRVFQSVAGGNVGNQPKAGGTAAWLDTGPTNQWAMFDQGVGTATSATGSITITADPGTPIDALAIVDTNAASVRVSIRTNGVSTYVRTLSALATNPPVDGYTYSAADTEQLTAIIFQGLPGVLGCELHVEIDGPDPNGPVSVGTFLMGRVVDLGSTEVGGSIGIDDYSRKDTDDYGVTTIVQRAWAKTMQLKSMVPTAAVDSVQRMLAKLRAVPALWVGEDGFDSLTIYGFFKSFSVDLTLANWSYVNLTVEGLI